MTIKELIIARMTFTQMLGNLITFASMESIPILVDYVLRDLKTQERLVTSGKSKTMKSKHLNALAADIYVVNVEDHVLVTDGTDERYKRLGEYWVSIGGTWGGHWKTFKDSVHFEYDPYDDAA